MNNLRVKDVKFQVYPCCSLSYDFILAVWNMIFSTQKANSER